jgi:hypothetical protein
MSPRQIQTPPSGQRDRTIRVARLGAAAARRQRR